MSNIFLCDDSPMILRMLEKRLGDAGFKIVGKAKDGVECLDLYPDAKPDLLLLDVTMPNKDGRECLRDLISTNPSAKVIMVSALTDPKVVQQCLADGAKAFINKSHLSSPDDFNVHILTVIRTVLSA